MSTGAPTQPPEARAKIAALFRRPNLLFWPIIVIAIVLHVQLGDAFDLRVVLAGAILVAGSAVDFNAERTAPYAFGLPGLMDGPPAPSKMSHSVYARVSAVVVVASDRTLRLVWQTRKVIRALGEYAPTIGMGFAGRSGGPWQLRMMGAIPSALR